MSATIHALDYSALPEPELVAYAKAGRREAFAALMTRGNQRLFRVARSIVRDEVEAEDVLQEAYVRAFAKLAEFRGEASIFTWLTRIVINEARGRLRKRRETVGLEALEAAQDRDGTIVMFPTTLGADDPERDAARSEMRRLLERAVDGLPEPFRVVFILRDIEGATMAETSDVLGVRPETVKTRLHRARAMLRDNVEKKIGPVILEAFPFAGRRCDRLTDAVLKRLGYL